METEVLTPFEIKFRLQSLYNIIDEGLTVGIQFPSLEQAVIEYCSVDFIEPSYFGCETFAEVTDLLLEQYRHLNNYPNC